MALQNYIFIENRLKIVAMTVFDQRCLFEASKSLPRASQEPSQSPQEALHSLQEPPVGPPRRLQGLALQTFLDSLIENKTCMYVELHRCMYAWVQGCMCASCPYQRL